jgi:quinol-cytochrome oxidoreductase complex cytochrome b subunit
MEEKHMQTTEKEEGIPFFPNHFLKEIIVMAIILWYFLANYKFLQLAEHFSFIGAWAPKVLGIITQIFVALLLILFPFFDKNPYRHPRRRPFMVTFGILAIVGYGTLLYLGYIK